MPHNALLGMESLWSVFGELSTPDLWRVFGELSRNSTVFPGEWKCSPKMSGEWKCLVWHLPHISKVWSYEILLAVVVPHNSPPEQPESRATLQLLLIHFLLHFRWSPWTLILVLSLCLCSNSTWHLKWTTTFCSSHFYSKAHNGLIFAFIWFM